MKYINLKFIAIKAIIDELKEVEFEDITECDNIILDAEKFIKKILNLN